MRLIRKLINWWGRWFPSRQRFESTVLYFVESRSRNRPGEPMPRRNLAILLRTYYQIDPPAWLFNYRLCRMERSGVIRSWEGGDGQRVYALPEVPRSRVKVEATQR